MRLAVKVYELGLAPTKGKAAKLVGLSPAAFYGRYRKGVECRDLKQEANRIVAIADEKIVDVSAYLAKTSLEAVKEIHGMMKNPAMSEGVRLKAAIDLADRGPETSKTQKIQATTYSMDGKDVKELAAALVAAREARMNNTEGLVGDVVKVIDVKEPIPMISDGLRRTA